MKNSITGPFVLWCGSTKDEDGDYAKTVLVRVVAKEAPYNKEGVAWHMVFEVEDGKDAMGEQRWRKWPNEAFPAFLSKVVEMFIEERKEALK